MAAIFDTVDKGLQRTADLVPANQEYYTATWWAYVPYPPPSGVVRTFYMIANSAARATQSMIVAQDSTGEVYLEVAGVRYTGTAGSIILKPGWHCFGVRRRVPTNFLEFHVDSEFIGTAGHATIPFSTWTFNEMYLGVDPRHDGSPSQAAYFREFIDFMSYGQEWGSSIPVNTTDLVTDTPLYTDLLDTTVNNHDWIHAGGATATFYDVPYAVEGSFGGWWRHSSLMLPQAAEAGLLLQVEAGGFLFSLNIRDLGFVFDGSHYVDSDWRITLRYATGPSQSNYTDLMLDNPYPDYGIGQGPAPLPPRGTWCLPTRWAVKWKTGTRDPITGVYAADGHIKLFMNGTEILGATGITLPRTAAGGSSVIYSVGVRADCDRVWARTVAEIPTTDDGGMFVGGLPNGLVFFDDFDGGDFSDWQVFSWYPGGGGGYNEIPNAYSDTGGDNGYGLSVFSNGPYFGSAGSPPERYRPWSGLRRTFRFPPINLATTGQPPPPVEPPEPPFNPPGIYVIDTGVGTIPGEEDGTTPPSAPTGVGPPHIPSIRFDSYYGTSPVDYEQSIPSPTVRTAFIGD